MGVKENMTLSVRVTAHSFCVRSARPERLFQSDLLTCRSYFVATWTWFVPVSAVRLAQKDRHFNGIISQTTCKPGSVQALRPGTAIHLRRASLRASCDQPGQRDGNVPASTALDFSRSASPAAPIRSCSRWGLPCRPRCRGRGALLPHHFTLARPWFPMRGRYVFCGTVPGVAPAGGWPAPYSRGARTFLRLSAAAIRSSGAADMRARRWGVNSRVGSPEPGYENRDPWCYNALAPHPTQIG